MQGSQLLINHYEPADTTDMFRHEKQASPHISEVMRQSTAPHL